MTQPFVYAPSVQSRGTENTRVPAEKSMQGSASLCINIVLPQTRFSNCHGIHQLTTRQSAILPNHGKQQTSQIRIGLVPDKTVRRITGLGLFAGWRNQKAAVSLAAFFGKRHAVKLAQHQPLRAVLAVLAQLTVFEYAKGFAGVVGTHYLGGVKDVAKFVTGEAVEAGVVGVKFGAQLGAALGVEGEWRAVVAEVLGPGGQVVGGVGQL